MPRSIIHLAQQGGRVAARNQKIRREPSLASTISRVWSDLTTVCARPQSAARPAKIQVMERENMREHLTDGVSSNRVRFN